MMYGLKDNVCSQESITRMTISINDDLMEALLTHTKAKTKTKAIDSPRIFSPSP